MPRSKGSGLVSAVRARKEVLPPVQATPRQPCTNCTRETRQHLVDQQVGDRQVDPSITTRGEHKRKRPVDWSSSPQNKGRKTVSYLLSLDPHLVVPRNILICRPGWHRLRDSHQFHPNTAPHRYLQEPLLRRSGQGTHPVVLHTELTRLNKDRCEYTENRHRYR